MRRTAEPSGASSRILAESLEALDEPLALLLATSREVSPPQVCRSAARALLDLPSLSPRAPPWLAPHQVPAFERLLAILHRFGGAVLADAVGLGKSWVSLAIACALDVPLTLAVPAVLAPQWRGLLRRLGVQARLITHESLSRDPPPEPIRPAAAPSLIVVDEAHRFREPDTRRYRALARLAIGSRVLLVTATPVHNRRADLLHLLRLFLRDDALVGLGLASLAAAARERTPCPNALPILARLVVARSRRRIVEAWRELHFPARSGAVTIRAASVVPALVPLVTDTVRRLRPPVAAAALFRLLLLRQFASSGPALHRSLRRYEEFLVVAREARQAGRRIGAQEFRSLFPVAGDDALQLAFLPLLLAEAAPQESGEDDLATIRFLLQQVRAGPDPKAEALERVLATGAGKTIVFAVAAATVAYLRRRLMRRFRVAAVSGRGGWMGADRVSRREVLAAFAPRAQGAADPPPASTVDVLIATDLLSEGLDLQDAERVVHYDLPWSPARLAQRVGRIDRLASPHRRIETVTFLPPEPLARALELEQRLAHKVAAQLDSGSAQVERISGRDADQAPLDWCDRLQRLTGGEAIDVSGGAAAVTADRDAGVLVFRMGADVEAIVVADGRAVADPVSATSLLELASQAPVRPLDRAAVTGLIRAALPVVRERLDAIATARWRATDRDRVGRRLVPLALAAARRAARRGEHERLGRLDTLLSRLTGGQTAGEALLLDAILTRRTPIGVRDLLAWHEGLPPLRPAPDPVRPELIAVILFVKDVPAAVAGRQGLRTVPRGVGPLAFGDFFPSR
jgi:hypothetical protein